MGPPPGPAEWGPDPYGAPPPGGSGQFGPPQKSGSSTGLIIVIIVLVVAAVGGLAFVLTSGDDDDDDTATDPATEPGQQVPGGDDQVTNLPGGDDTVEPPDVTLPPDDPGDPDIPSGDVQEMTTSWVYSNTPGGVDMTESACIAEVVILIVGEDEVGAAGGDLDAVYGGTSFEQDAEIRSGISPCVDSDSAAALASDSGWHWPPD